MSAMYTGQGDFLLDTQHTATFSNCITDTLGPRFAVLFIQLHFSGEFVSSCIYKAVGDKVMIPFDGARQIWALA